MPSRSLDRIVAPLAGWEYRQAISRWIEPGGEMAHVNPPNFSSDIAAAKQVQAKLFSDGYDLQIWQSHNPTDGGSFLVQASKNAYYSLDAPDPIWAAGDTEALAICRVARLVNLPTPTPSAT